MEDGQIIIHAQMELALPIHVKQAVIPIIIVRMEQDGINKVLLNQEQELVKSLNIRLFIVEE